MLTVQQIMQEANTLARAGRFPEAVACLEDAAAGAPDQAPVWVSLGMMRTTVGNLEGAEEALRKAVSLDDHSVDAHLCLGILLANDQRTGDADTMFRRALDLAPRRVDVSHAYSRVLADTARTDEALAVIRAAQKLAPNDLSLQDKVCCLLNYIAGIDPATVFAEHKKFGQLMDKLVGDPAPIHRISDRSPGRRLRIGYLSGDLREHSVAYFLEPLLEHHDRAGFEVCCYHIGAPDDKATPRLKTKVDRWTHLFPVTDDALAGAIAADGIDIVVELAGHAQGNRLSAVARRAAPVIVTFIGYPNTTGVPAVGYRIVDARTDPPGSDQWATEKLIRLDGCFLCYRPYHDAPDPAPRPHTGPEIVFGSFNNLAKLSELTLDLWGKVMAKVPGSSLMLKGKGLGDATVSNRVLSLLARSGISADRVRLAGHTKTTREHLALYNEMDIALDPFPYCGTTTTCEAMWMGVPVVTLEGQVHAGRVGVSLLETVGLPDLIAHSQDEYIAIAAALAGDPARRAELRRSLRDRVRYSALGDAPAYTRRLEAAYRSMWSEWCSAPAPKGFFSKLWGG